MLPPQFVRGRPAGTGAGFTAGPGGALSWVSGSAFTLNTLWLPAKTPAPPCGSPGASRRPSGYRTVDDPHGIGTTTINGVNDRGQLVGFYVDSAGNTDGFLAAP